MSEHGCLGVVIACVIGAAMWLGLGWWLLSIHR